MSEINLETYAENTWCKGCGNFGILSAVNEAIKLLAEEGHPVENIVIASGIGGVTTLLDQYDVLKEKGVRRVSPHTVPMLMPNGPSANVGLAVGARAGVHTPVSACASGAEAIGYAIEMIRTGRADVVVAADPDRSVPLCDLPTQAALGQSVPGLHA